MPLEGRRRDPGHDLLSLDGGVRNVWWYTSAPATRVGDARSRQRRIAARIRRHDAPSVAPHDHATTARTATPAPSEPADLGAQPAVPPPLVEFLLHAAASRFGDLLRQAALVAEAERPPRRARPGRPGRRAARSPRR